MTEKDTIWQSHKQNNTPEDSYRNIYQYICFGKLVKKVLCQKKKSKEGCLKF